jgi:kanamycin kinase
VSDRPVISQIPGADAPVPARVRTLAGDRVIRPVWVNELGGRTFELTDPAGERAFVKWNPLGNGIDLFVEAGRLSWAQGYLRVPRVLDAGADDTEQWLVTRAVPGSSAVSPRWRAEPSVAVTAVGEGLRALHEGLPVADCPFTFSVEERRAAAHVRATSGPRRSGAAERARWDAAHTHLTWDDALRVLADPPPSDTTVVCHGDACAPNTLVGDDGRWSGHVDLGRLGVADRWADIAVATWSTQWNYGPGWEPLLLAAYGVAPDPDRMAWYRLLWDLS